MRELLSGANLEATPNRVHVLEVVGENKFPLSASDIYKILKRSSTINQVTVYRILDLLVENGIVESHQHGRQGILLRPGAQ
jgi:Fur family ferric uptake transcriptional regulator